MIARVCLIQVSIHAPARGATKFTVFYKFFTERFNPRAREGRDNDVILLADSTVNVSIHAPARGATRAIRLNLTRCISFNPRAREGRDQARREKSSKRGVSIHAPARGATIFF